MGWKGKDDANEQGPGYAYIIACDSQPTVTHKEWTRFEHDVWMIVEHSSTKDRNDIAQIQCHRSQREDSVGSNGTRKIQ
jgi:hypothetical protein